jgi:hypothetical protein
MHGDGVGFHGFDLDITHLCSLQRIPLLATRTYVVHAIRLYE